MGEKEKTYEFAEEVKAELKKIIEEKLGGKHYQFVIAWEGMSEAKTGGVQIQSATLSNMDFRKTPYITVKGVYGTIFSWAEIMKRELEGRVEEHKRGETGITAYR